MRISYAPGLTIAQRIEIKPLDHQEQIPTRNLMDIYQVSRPTICKWIHRESPFDCSSRPHPLPWVITAEYRQAVLGYLQDNPSHGVVRIACQLKAAYAFDNRGRVLKVLQQNQLTAKSSQKPTIT